MAKKKKTPKSSLLTQAQLLAKSLIDPQIAEFNREAAAKEARAQQQQATSAAVAQTIHAMSGGDAERIRQAYSQAGQDISGFSRGVTGAIGATAQQSAADTAAKLAQYGAPAVGGSGQMPGMLSTLQYQGGQLPASDLAGAGANWSSHALLSGENQGYATLQQGQQLVNATNEEANALRQKGYDLENTRPGEIQKALLVLREERRKDRNLAMQQAASNAQIFSLLSARADQMTDQTGTLHVVRNGKIVDTGRRAPGSTAVTHAADVNARTASANERAQHDLVMEGIAQGQLDVSQQRADAYVKRQQQYANGGFSPAQIAKWKTRAGQIATNSFKGVPNPNYVAGVDPTDPNYLKKRDKWLAPPRTAEAVLRQLLAEQVPYQIVYTAIRAWAKAQGSRWAGAMKWQKVWPPPRKK